MSILIDGLNANNLNTDNRELMMYQYHQFMTNKVKLFTLAVSISTYVDEMSDLMYDITY